MADNSEQTDPRKEGLAPEGEAMAAAAEAVAEDAGVSAGQRIASGRWALILGVVVLGTAVVYATRLYSGGGDAPAGGLSSLPVPELGDPNRVSPLAREAAEVRRLAQERTQPALFTDLLPDAEAAAEEPLALDNYEDAAFEEPAVAPPPRTEAPALSEPESVAGVPEETEPEPALPVPQPPRTEAPALSEPEPAYYYAGETAAGGGEENPVRYGTVLVMSAPPAAAPAKAAEPAAAAPALRGRGASGVTAHEWMGRLQFSWDSRSPGPDAVVNILSGPYAGESFRMNITQSEHQVAGSGGLRNCDIVGMREDFSTPMFAPDTPGARARRAAGAVARHAVAGIAQAADIYAAYLQARSQPVTPVIQFGSLGGGETEAGGEVSVSVRNNVPEPELGRVAVGGAAQSVARSIETNNNITVVLPAGYPIGLAAVCQGDPS